MPDGLVRDAEHYLHTVTQRVAAEPNDRALRPGEFAVLCTIAEGKGYVSMDKRYLRALCAEIIAIRARLTAAAGEESLGDEIAAALPERIVLERGADDLL